MIINLMKDYQVLNNKEQIKIHNKMQQYKIIKFKIH